MNKLESQLAAVRFHRNLIENYAIFALVNSPEKFAQVIGTMVPTLRKLYQRTGSLGASGALTIPTGHVPATLQRAFVELVVDELEEHAGLALAEDDFVKGLFEDFNKIVVDIHALVAGNQKRCSWGWKKCPDDTCVPNGTACPIPIPKIETAEFLS